MRGFAVDMLEVRVYAERAEMGRAAAEAVAERIGEVLAKRGEVNIIFAAAPSQNEVLAALVGMTDFAGMEGAGGPGGDDGDGGLAGDEGDDGTGGNESGMGPGERFSYG
jgi:hypothetical protein